MLSGWNEVGRRTKARWLIDELVLYASGKHDRVVERAFSGIVVWANWFALGAFAVAYFVPDFREYEVPIVVSILFAASMLLAPVAGLLRYRSRPPAWPMTNRPSRWLQRAGIAFFAASVLVAVLDVSFALTVVAIQTAFALLT